MFKILFVVVMVTGCVKSSVLLYPFGVLEGDQFLDAEEDTSSPAIHLSTPIKFFSAQFNSIYINENGMVSFLTEIPSYYNVEFPLGYPLIAAFYADVDIEEAGSVWFRRVDRTTTNNTQDEAVLSRAAADVQAHFWNRRFLPNEVFIATWEKVGSFGRQGNQVNTFQIVIASDENESFLTILYPDGGIQWIRGQGKNPTRLDAFAQAGIISGDGRMFTLPYSGKDQVRNLDRWSNVNAKGVWMYRLGPLEHDNNIEDPVIIGHHNHFDPEQSRDCSLGATVCHSKASCQAYGKTAVAKNFCCKCNHRWFGNGRSCLQDGVPHAIAGTVNGNVNGVEITNQRLHCYVLTESGRVYTAILELDPSIGYDLQSLSPIATPITWLFSNPIRGSGFATTGGILKYVAVASFRGSQSGHRVTINFEFHGLDAFSSLSASLTVRGTIPSLAKQAEHRLRVQVDDYEEEFTQTRPGVFRSRSLRSFSLERSKKVYQFDLEQTITFEVGNCSTFNARATKLRSMRNYINFEKEEKAVRFATTGRLTSLTFDDEEDPCVNTDCEERAYCVVVHQQPQCTCQNGFEHRILVSAVGRRRICADIDECQRSSANKCSSDATCVNSEGSYSCFCRPGYLGDGIQCTARISCEHMMCHYNAKCVNGGGHASRPPRCQCMEGYSGDGVSVCDPIPSDVVFRTYSRPERIWFVADEQSPTQTEFIHVYEVANRGPRALIDLTLQIRLGDGAALQNVPPRIRYGTGKLGDWCEQLGGRKKRDREFTSSSSNYDYFYDANFSTAASELFEGSELVVSTSDRVMGGRESSSTAAATYICSMSLPLGESALVPLEFNLRVVKDRNKFINFTTLGTLLPNEAIRNNGELESIVWTLAVPRDGFEKENDVISGCNVINKCGRLAKCQFDPDEGGYRCRCDAARGFEGDGFVCKPRFSCIDLPAVCDTNAECVNVEAAGASCRCRNGFFGDGHSCDPAETQVEDFLLVSQGMALTKVGLDDDDLGSVIYVKTPMVATGVDIDCSKGKMYWTDMAGKAIWRANYDGSDAEAVLEQNSLDFPEGIAIDSTAGNVYWTDSGRKTVEVASLDVVDPTRHRRRKVLFRGDTGEGVRNPRGITATADRLFWSDWDRRRPRIETSNLDGTGRMTLVDTQLGTPNSLAVHGNVLCWTDGGSRPAGVAPKIECIGIDGTGRTVVTAKGNNADEMPYGIAMTATTIYWTDWKMPEIHVANRESGERLPSLPHILQNIGRPFDIAFVPEECPLSPATNINCRGRCNPHQICLPDGRGRAACHNADRMFSK